MANSAPAAVVVGTVATAGSVVVHAAVLAGTFRTEVITPGPRA